MLIWDITPLGRPGAVAAGAQATLVVHGEGREPDSGGAVLQLNGSRVLQ